MAAANFLYRLPLMLNSLSLHTVIKSGLSFLVICLLFMACGNSYQKVLKSSDSEFKLQKANEYYEKGDCAKAIPLFEELIPIYKGSKSIDDIYYNYADCHFQQGEYLVASFHFKNIYDSYPSSEWAEESLYMHAYSQYMLSPDVNLDQTYSEKALDAFQLFITAYSESARVAECNGLIDILRSKLATKMYKSAQLYLKIEKYRAAAVTFNNLLKNFPETKYAEEAAYLVVKSYYLYAMNSIASKQDERYSMAVEAYKDFAFNYETSKYMKEATQLYNASLNNLNP
jgi:outer membrane protein assembly factor BamD